MESTRRRTNHRRDRHPAQPFLRSSSDDGMG
jgi:hypothetical protein